MPRYDEICFCDFETFFSDEYSLKNKSLTMTQYIRHEQFKTHMVAVKMSSWSTGRVMSPPQFFAFVQNVDWSRTAFCAHHTQFDGLILTHHYDVYPCFWLDTLTMSRIIFGVDEGHTLGEVAQRFGHAGKLDGGKPLEAVKGVRDLSREQYKELAKYNIVDLEALELIYYKMLRGISEDELRTIDTTIAMYCEPVLKLDDEVVLDVQGQERARKEALLNRTELTKVIIGSSEKFATFLRAQGVEPPMKPSPAHPENLTYAFAKTDLDFQELLDHPNPIVAAAVEARLGTKGSLVETRSARMLTFAGEPMPIYLAYYGARTGRWGGGDKSNWQNLPRRGLGAALRNALCAPDGYKVISSDAAQIEARLVAWRSGQDDIVELFAAGEDVYAHNATAIYMFPVEQSTHPLQRFVGKVFTLSAGFGAGHVKMNHTLRSGKDGPKVDVSLDETKEQLTNWRFANRYIVAHWSHLNDIARAAFLNKTSIDDGVLTFEGHGDDGYIHLPGGTYIRYKNIQYDPETRNMFYASRKGPVKLYGGILEENTIQALARVIFCEHINAITAEMPDVRIALLVHDDIVSVAPEDVVLQRAERINQIMSTPPTWAKGLPLNAETKVGEVYGKTQRVRFA